MIRLKRGKPTDERLKLVQFCNDWISADASSDDGSRAVIVSPMQVQLETPEEIAAFRNDTNPGTFWSEFSLDDETGRFTRIRRR